MIRRGGRPWVLLVSGLAIITTAGALYAGGVLGSGEDTLAATSAGPSASEPAPTPTAPPGVGPTRTNTPRATASGDSGATASGFPNASNTGVPKGRTLKASGGLRIRKVGAVIDGYDIHGEVSVEANNVTIVNTRIVNSGDFAIIQRPGFGGLVVERSEIRGNGKQVLTKAIFNIGGMLTVRRSNISLISDGVFTTHGLIEDNYLHNPGDFAGEHIDMIQADGGPAPGLSLVIRRNTIINTTGQTSAVALFDGDGPANNILVERNLLAGGGYTLYAGGEGGGSHNIRIVGNVWTRDIFPKGGYWGPVAYWEGGGPGNVWRDNVWADTGEPVKP